MMRLVFMGADTAKNGLSASTKETGVPKKRSWFFRKLLGRILRSNHHVKSDHKPQGKYAKHRKSDKSDDSVKKPEGHSGRNLEKNALQQVPIDVDGIVAQRVFPSSGNGKKNNSTTEGNSLQSLKSRREGGLAIQKADVFANRIPEKENHSLYRENLQSRKKQEPEKQELEKQGLEKKERIKTGKSNTEKSSTDKSSTDKSNTEKQIVPRQRVARSDAHLVVKQNNAYAPRGKVKNADSPGQQHQVKQGGNEIVRKSSPKAKAGKNVKETKAFGLGHDKNSSTATLPLSFNEQTSSHLNAASLKTEVSGSIPTSSHDDLAGMAEQLAARVSRALMSGRSSISIRLDPPELGEINVVFSRKTGKLRVVIQCSQSTSYSLLQQEIGQLEKRLTQMGVDSAVVDLAQPEQGGQNDESAHQGAGTNNGVEHGKMGSVPEKVDTMEITKSVKPESGLDLLV